MNASIDRAEFDGTGWRIIAACSLASAAGVVLLFFSFSLFVLPIMAELHVSRGQLGAVQALVVTGALGAPAIGWLTDRLGAARVYTACAVLVAAGEFAMARFAHSVTALAVSIAFIGFVGIGTSAVTVTRPVNAHFVRHRGKALGMVAAGVSISTILAPLPLQAALDLWGWRGAVIALGLTTLAIGVPAMLFLLPRSVGGAALPSRAEAGAADGLFLKTRAFWLITLSGVAVGAATSSFISQLSPMIQAEGVGPMTGALALSLFAAGQFFGRIGGGLMLDRLDPRRAAVAMLAFPGIGFALLLGFDHWPALALAASFLVGALSGAEVDIGAFFIARSFPIRRYSAIFGAMHGIGWLGNAAGVIGVGFIHDRYGSYAPAQAAALIAVLTGTGLIAAVRLSAVTMAGQAAAAREIPAV